MPEEVSALQLRVNSCLAVIRDICERLRQEELHPKLVDQLKKLNELLALLDHKAITESDLARIERSTNLLLEELRLIFSQQGLGNIYQEPLH